ncbi:MAG: hypothetical protein JNG89_06330 [Planctomycetaceae bacterium]|nr:hypothetical protein [Planctomycetaceae bacterium]
MPESPRILLVTPSAVQLRPPSDFVTHVTLNEIASLRSGPRPPDFDFLIQGAATGEVATEVLMHAINGHDGESTLLLPLDTYDWLNHVPFLPPRMLALLPGIGRGVLMVVPKQRWMDLQKPPQDANVREDLARFSRREFPIQLAPATQPVASAVHSFIPPLLAPNSRGKHTWSRPHFDKLWLNDIEGDAAAATTVRAGIAQLNDLLDESHNLAQSIEGHHDGDYWHAIMHRREPDYGNSKYWFRHVGQHPVFGQLAPRAADTLNNASADIRSHWAPKLKVDSNWDPFAFVDLCEAAARDEDSSLGLTARRIQWLEMLLLLKHCCDHAATCHEAVQILPSHDEVDAKAPSHEDSQRKEER